MKQLIKLVALTILISSCGGNDNTPTSPNEEGKELSSFDLVFPDHNLICTEGNDVGENKVSIEFIWTASENATAYDLKITSLDTGEIIRVTSTTTSEEVILAKDTQFSWNVTATLNDSDKVQNSSTQRSFYSEGIAEENFAPFPAEILTEDQLNGFVAISWEGADLDNDINTTELYFGQDVDNLEFISATDSANGSSNQPIVYSTDYFIEVITTDDLGNSSSSKTTINY